MSMENPLSRHSPKKRDFLKTASLVVGGFLTPNFVKAASKSFEKSKLAKDFSAESGLEKSGDPLTLTVKAEFVTATTEFADETAGRAASRAIELFLTKAQLSNIDLMTAEIEVVGTYSVERDWKNNNMIAEARMNLGLDVLRKVLIRMGFNDEQIDQMNIKSSFGGKSIKKIYTPEQLRAMDEKATQEAIDGCQGFDIKIKAVPKEIEKLPPSNELKSFKVIVIDRSESMQNDMSEVDTELKQINSTLDKPIKTFEVQGGSNEAHLTTLFDIMNKPSFNPRKEQTRMLLLTDEPDNRLNPNSYETNITYVLGLARDNRTEIMVKVYNPNKDEGGFKMFSLNKNKNALMAPKFYKENTEVAFQWYKDLPNS